MGRRVVAGSLLAVALLLGAGARAADVEPYQQPANVPPPESRFAVGITGGTLGIGGEVSAKAFEWMVLRANASGFSVSGTRTYRNNTFQGSAKVLGAGLLADLHPFSNGFRFSAGVRYHDFQPSGSVNAAVAVITINNTPYPTTAIGALHAKIKTNTVGPYLGLGFDSTHFSSGNFFFGFDLGAIYLGKPKVALSTDRNVPGLDTDLGAEEKKINDQIKNFGIYPVIMLTGKYRF
ncbi:MAG: hypothetical protein QOI12_2976 [Alphaproteobacteria bacterium]|jgi:hypothetical protein|nr:hypothetical protein [Alphaproteobacteria bacterium]